MCLDKVVRFVRWVEMIAQSSGCQEMELGILNRRGPSYLTAAVASVTCVKHHSLTSKCIWVRAVKKIHKKIVFSFFTLINRFFCQPSSKKTVKVNIWRKKNPIMFKKKNLTKPFWFVLIKPAGLNQTDLPWIWILSFFIIFINKIKKGRKPGL